MLLVDDVSAWLRRNDWMRLLGEYHEVGDEDWGAVTSRRVHYIDGVEAEFGFTTGVWAGTPLDEGTARVIKEGFTILYDPSGLLEGAVMHAATQGAAAAAAIEGSCS